MEYSVEWEDVGGIPSFRVKNRMIISYDGDKYVCFDVDDLHFGMLPYNIAEINDLNLGDGVVLLRETQWSIFNFIGFIEDDKQWFAWKLKNGNLIAGLLSRMNDD